MHYLYNLYSLYLIKWINHVTRIKLIHYVFRSSFVKHWEQNSIDCIETIKMLKAMLLWKHSNLQCDYCREVKYSSSAKSTNHLKVKKNPLTFWKSSWLSQINSSNSVLSVWCSVCCNYFPTVFFFIQIPKSTWLLMGTSLNNEQTNALTRFKLFLERQQHTETFYQATQDVNFYL